MLKFVSLGATALTVLSIRGCGLPSFTRYSDRSLQVAPAGPSVAALIANVKCELWEAANDTTQLPYYEDTPAMKEEHFADDSDRNFTLRNFFEEIEHVAELKLTLEMTNTGAVNPSANFITPYSTGSTNMTLAVGGQLAESADRILDIFQSIDFQRLVASPENPRFVRGITVGDYKFTFKGKEPPQARPPYAASADISVSASPCDHGAELAGNLGLKETLAATAIASRMQDVAVLINNTTGPTGAPSGTVYGQPAPTTGFSSYSFGQADTQIDFTINANINAGPNWTLLRFKGPGVTNAVGPYGQGLLNFTSLAHDTLIITVMPVCIRQKYFPKQWEHLTPDKLVASAGPQPLSLANSREM